MELAEKAGAPLIKYGAFINSMVDFVIIAFAIFMAVKAINKTQASGASRPAAPAPTPEDIAAAGNS
jgi:large conductance mechanosensitive channel